MPCDGTGAAFYGDRMTDDGLMVLADGAIMDRDDVVASLKQSPSWASYSIDEPRVIRIGDDSAALVYLGTGRRAGDDPPFVGAMTSVYLRRGGEWKLAVYQQTPCPADDR